MSGGLRTSVKGYLIAQRLNLATEPLSENETISNNVTAPLDPPPQLVEEMTMDTGTYGLGICDGNIPCFPMLNSGKRMAAIMTRTRAEIPPPQGNSNSMVSSVSMPSTPQTEGEILMSSNLKNFFFNELKTATRNFRPDSMVGEGGFGCVGRVDENALTAAKPGTGMVIAVKRLNQGGLQGHKECLAEINYLGQLRHPNLVKLIGYCLEDDHRLLVYEFMPRGSLDNHLFKRASYFQPPSWSLRMKIALGAAKVLAFLHSDEAQVFYGDFKTSDILLDSAYNAKFSDFGLAKDGPAGDGSHATTGHMGTYGYAAPEYIFTGHFTAKSDVYSFGVVMLEMLSGRRAVDKNRPTGEHNLVEWAKPYLASKRRVLQVFDARIDDQYSVAAALKAANLANRCLATEPKFRLIMSDVVKSLEASGT